MLTIRARATVWPPTDGKSALDVERQSIYWWRAMSRNVGMKVPAGFPLRAAIDGRAASIIVNTTPKNGAVVHIRHLSKAVWLYEQRSKLAESISRLNQINGTPDDQLLPSFPKDVVDLVDQRLAAKGMLSLAIESLAEVEKELELLGIEV